MRNIKRKIFLFILLLCFIVVLLVIIIAASPLSVENVIATKQFKSNYNNTNVVSSGDRVELRPQYKAGLAGFRKILWRYNNGTDEVYSSTLTITIDNINTTVECQVVYGIASSVFKRSSWYTWSLGQQTDSDYLFYHDNVIQVPDQCILSASPATGQATIDIASQPLCIALKNITLGSILISIPSNTLQNQVLKPPTLSTNQTEINVIFNITQSGPLDIINYANFNSQPLFNFNTSSSSSILFNSFNQQYKGSNVNQIQLNQLTSLGDGQYTYNINIPEKIFNPISSVAFGVSATGYINVNPKISAFIDGGLLQSYQIEWDPEINLQLLGSLVINAQIDVSPSFNIWEADLPGSKLFGLAVSPTFSFPLKLQLQTDAQFSADMIGNIHVKGSYSTKFKPYYGWYDTSYTTDPATSQDLQFTPTSFTTCNANVLVEVGIALGVTMVKVLDFSLSRSVQFGWKYVTPSPGYPDLYNAPGKQPSISSNASCTSDTCYCQCPTGDQTSAFQGSYINIGWNADISLTIWKIFGYDFLDHRFLDYNIYIGPQICIAKKAACGKNQPAICPYQIFTGPSSCVSCPAGTTLCNNPAANPNLPGDAWCTLASSNGGLPYTPIPSGVCPYFNPYLPQYITCTGKCCPGNYYPKFNNIHVHILKVTDTYKWNQIKESIKLLALYGNLDDLKKLYINNNDDILNLLEHNKVPLQEIIKSKRLETLKYFFSDLKWDVYLVSQNDIAIDKFKTTFEIAASYGSLEIIQYLDQMNKDLSIDLSGCTTDALDSSASNGNLEMIKWLHLNRTEGCTSDAMDYAAKNGHLETIKWLHENRSEGCTTYAMDSATWHGHLEIIKWLHHNRTEGCTSEAMDNAAKNGHLEIIEWLHMNRTEGCTTGAMDNASWYGHLEIIKWLHQNRSEGCTTYAIDYAAQNGHFETIKWLHHHQSEGCTTGALDYAAKNGHLEIIKWLHENRTEGCSSDAINFAAENDHLETIKWLHYNRSEGCSTNAMDYAAWGGYLETVKWLHHNRNEGCTIGAMNYAAENGHLETIKWLHENRTEGCTTDAMDKAAHKGHLEIVKWLHENRTEGCTTWAMDNAAHKGHLEIIKWLHENRNEGCTTWAMDYAIQNGYLEIVKWLYHNRNEGFTKYAMVNAVKNKHTEIVEWLNQTSLKKN